MRLKKIKMREQNNKKKISYIRLLHVNIYLKYTYVKTSSHSYLPND